MKIETSLIKEKTRITNDKKLDKELKSFVLFLNSFHKLEFEISDYPNSSYLLKETLSIMVLSFAFLLKIIKKAKS